MNAREIVKARAGERCERCGTNWSEFWSIHHRRPRGMGGSKRAEINSPANLILLCGSGTTGCHGWIESNRAQAYEDGLLVRSGVDPRSVPVRLRAGRVWLLPDGDMQPCRVET